MVDALDSKSSGACLLVGSSPTPGTIRKICTKRYLYFLNPRLIEPSVCRLFQTKEE